MADAKKSRPGSLKLLSIRGVEIRIHFSLIFLMAYVVFVAAAQFPYVAARSGVNVYGLPWGPWVWGALFALGLFLSILVHELGHVFVAESYGVRARSITLMMLGGVSEMDRMPEIPYAELKLAVAGPLVSLALFGILWFIHARASSPGLSFYSYWLGSTNLVLGIFNLLPAFPLDGGRAYRSFLAARRGQVRATRTAVAVSKALAWVLGIIGFLQFNVLLMLIGFFIHFMAQNELFVLMSKSLLKDYRVGDLATRCEPISVNASLEHAAKQLSLARQLVLPVSLDSGAATVLSLADFKRVDRALWPTTPVRNVVGRGLKPAATAEPVASVFPEILETPANALPVTEGDRIVGVITYEEISALLQLKSLDRPSGDEENPKAA